MIPTKEYTHKVLSCAYAVHSALGPGLLESVYEKALVYELSLQGFEVKNQVPVKIKYKNFEIDEGLRLDLLVDDKLIIELKSVKELLPIHSKQLFTYLKLTGVELGYLINFNTVHLKDGIERVVVF